MNKRPFRTALFGAVAFIILIIAVAGCVVDPGDSSGTQNTDTNVLVYSVNYHEENGATGSVPTDSNSYKTGDIITVSGNTGGLALSGYTFAGWNTESDGSGTTYTAGDQFTMGSADVALFAQWSPIPTYNVNYHADDAESGSVPVDNNDYVEGSAVLVLSNTGGLIKTGYTFIGWNTASDGTGTSYLIGAEFSIGTVDVELYADWSADPTYTVTYYAGDADSGSVPVDSNNYLENTDVTVFGNTGNLVRPGYVFDCWNTDQNGSGTDYVEDEQFTMGTTNVALYAQWVNTGTVTIENPVSPLFSMTPTLFTLQIGGGTTAQAITVSAGGGGDNFLIQLGC